VTKAGVFARGVDLGPDLILGANANTTPGDDGRIFSDPAYASSDIVLVSNDNIRIDLDEDGSAESGDFEIYNPVGAKVFAVTETGDVTYGGSGRAAYPKPAYNSGWQTFAATGCRTMNHNLGGNADNYVVDLTFKKTGGGTALGVNNSGIGGDINGSTSRGGSWQNLTTTSIDICRWYGDVYTNQIRVRIWVYK
jgi:hypothetical protein